MVEEEKRMKLKSYLPTLILVIICIGAFLYASAHDFFREKKQDKAPLVDFNTSDVSSFSIQSVGTVIELTKQGQDKWAMTQPSPVPVNPFSAGSWVDALHSVTADKGVEDNASDLAKYGLDKPKQEFRVKLLNGSDAVLQVGNPMPIQGFYYVKTPGSPKVSGVSEQQISALNKAQLDFMNNNPFQFEMDKVTRLTAEWKGQKWSLDKADADKPLSEAKWKLNDKEMGGNDALPIVSDLQNSLMTDRLTKPAAQVTTDAPELKIELTLKDGGTSVYEGKNGRFRGLAEKTRRGMGYAVPAAKIDDFF